MATKIIYDLAVETYEEGRAVPVLTHIFHGDSPEQAQAFYRAHQKSDAFLRDCGKGKFKNIVCRNKVIGMRARRIKVR